jgi:hypothetical protein
MGALRPAEIVLVLDLEEMLCFLLLNYLILPCLPCFIERGNFTMNGALHIRPYNCFALPDYLLWEIARS